MQIFLGLSLLLFDCSSTQNYKRALDKIAYLFLSNCKKYCYGCNRYNSKMYYSEKKRVNDFLFGETDEMHLFHMSRHMLFIC